MRKTIDLTEKDVKDVQEYQAKNGFKNFSQAVRNIIRNIENGCSCDDSDVSDDNFALIADALQTINTKIDLMLPNIAPKSAGEVKG